MKITRAVITAAGRNQRTLPIQTLIERDGTEKALLRILVEEALSAGVEEIRKSCGDCQEIFGRYCPRMRTRSGWSLTRM